MIIKKISICLLAVGLASISLAETDAQARAAMQRGMDNYCSLILHGKSAQASALLPHFFAPDCIFVDKRGKEMKFAEWHKTIDREMKQLSHISEFSIQCTAFKSHGATAVGMTRFHLKANAKNPSNPKAPMVLVEDSTSKDAYKNVGGHWMTTRTNSITERMTINGKAVN